MPLTLGMPTLLETRSIEACAELCCELGLSFIELSMDLPEYQPDKIDIVAFTEIAKRYGIFYTIHLSGFLSPCDFNKRVAAAYTQTALEAIEVAKQLRAPILNMHLVDGDRFSLPEGKVYLFDRYADHYRLKLAEFRDKCTETIGKSDIKICVENANSGERAPFWAAGVDLLTESSAFAITFDIGHNATANFSAEPLILDRIDKLRHFHIHDATDARNHLTLGTGELDLVKYLRLAHSGNCRAVLETKTIESLRQSAAWLRENASEFLY